MWRQMIRFGIVGLLATAIHISIGYLLIQSSWQPLVANLIAFLIAFLVSFLGHLWFSFADHGVKVLKALSKFSIVAVIGFGSNQVLLTVIISQKILSSTIALCISTGCAALLTFALSRIWAFRPSKRKTVASFDVAK